MFFFAWKRFLKKPARKGFLLGEILLAVFVLAVGLTSIIAIIGNSLQYSLESQNIIVASQLAQEGIELVRNVRDNDFATGGTGFAAFSGSKHCRIDYNNSTTNLNCNSSLGSAARYTLTYSGGFYQHQESSQERFSRYVYINYSASDYGKATVRSFVYWGTFIPLSSGEVTGCTAGNRCVFNEVDLRGWK
ncbi:MAG: hypothetical protein Q7S04_03100 [Candidatus Moranbacteria bacterium]|nr:hypothetical protein [Candidatus Moranbacteria bacterium]